MSELPVVPDAAFEHIKFFQEIILRGEVIEHFSFLTDGQSTHSMEIKPECSGPSEMVFRCSLEEQRKFPLGTKVEIAVRKLP